MKVYVLVLDLSFEPGETLGVYSTQEKAEAALGREAKQFHSNLNIIEFDLDDESDE